MPPERRDELTLIQIVERCEQIARAVAGTTRAELARSESVQATIFWPLVVIGEEAGRLTKDVRSRHPEVPWNGVIAQRNFLAHAYDSVDFDVVWRNVTQRVPELHRQALAILRSDFPLAARALDERRTE